MKKLLHEIMAFRRRKGILRSPKSRHRQGLTSGFTLIELLVSALIASLMVAVMLGFLVGVLDSDRLIPTQLQPIVLHWLSLQLKSLAVCPM